MNKRITISFTVRNKGGSTGGNQLTHDVPEFDWELFKNTPNANEFVKKAYYAAVRKTIREINQIGYQGATSESDLETMEAVVTRSLSFTKEDINEWISTRDWNKASEIPDFSKILPQLKKHLPTLALRKNPFSEDISRRIADKIIAAVADKPVDPVADYMFSILTKPQISLDSLGI